MLAIYQKLSPVQVKIQLDVNNMASLRKSIFKPMLDQNLKSGRGGLTITSSKYGRTQNEKRYLKNFLLCVDNLECDDCGMAWLFRDNRDLLEFVQGNCIHNSTNVLVFEELSAYDFTNCTTDTDSINDSRSPPATWLYFIVLKMLGIN